MRKIIINFRIKILVVLSILILGSSTVMVSYAFYNYKIDHLEKSTIYNATMSCENVVYSYMGSYNAFDTIVPRHDDDAINSGSQVVQIRVDNKCSKGSRPLDLYFVPFKDTTISLNIVKYYYKITDLNNNLISQSSTYFLSNTNYYLTDEIIGNLELSQKGYSIDKFNSSAKQIFNYIYIPSGATYYIDVYFWIDYYEGGNNNSSYNKTLNGEFFLYSH